MFHELRWVSAKKAHAILMWAVIALLVINIALLLWYVFVGYKNSFHSDSAAKVLLAREIYDTGKFFPSNWNYVNGDLFVVFGHLVIIPLLAIMPAGYTVHAISGAVFATLILWSVWLVSGIATVHALRRIALVAVVASGISGFAAENMYGQVSYGVVLWFSCLTIFLAVKFQCATVHRQRWGALLVIVVALAYWANPKRAFISYSIPLLAAMLWLFLSGKTKNKSSLLGLLGMLLLGVLLGVGLYRMTFMNVINVQGAANARWLPIELVLRNAAFSFEGMYAQLGGLLSANAALFSSVGLYAGLRFFVATVAIALTPGAIRETIDNGDVGQQMLAVFAAVSFLSALFLQITTTIPDVNDPIQSSRYLFPGVLMCLLILLAMPLDWEIKPIWSFLLAIIVVALTLGAYQTYRKSGLNSERILAQPGQVNANRSQVLEILESKNLSYGYATYWNAGVLSVLSDEKVKIRQIFMSNGLPSPMRHLSSNRWYRPSAWKGRTFLLLFDSEIALIDWESMKRAGLVPVEHIGSNGANIYIFEENIAQKLPGWDSSYETPASFLPNINTPRKIGRIESDKQGAYMVASKGQAGILHYGPYVDVEPGRYRVTFDVLADHHNDEVIRLDVVAAPDQKLYGEKVLSISKGSQTIDISVDALKVMEFRVWSLGNEKVVFRGVSIVRLPAGN